MRAHQTSGMQIVRSLMDKPVGPVARRFYLRATSLAVNARSVRYSPAGAVIQISRSQLAADMGNERAPEAGTSRTATHTNSCSHSD